MNELRTIAGRVKSDQAAAGLAGASFGGLEQLAALVDLRMGLSELQP
jgi:hypothetical protein